MSFAEEVPFPRDSSEENGTFLDKANDNGARKLFGDEEERSPSTKSNRAMIGKIKSYAASGQKYLLSQPFVVHLLVIIFGISAWIGINGIYVQLPLLVISAPEEWNLAAYIVVMIQLANIGPATYTLARKFCPSLSETLCIFVLLLTGCSAMIFLAFYYERTLYVAGARHSVPMFVCVFLTALVGCTSSVLFMPYLRNSSEKYLVSYFIGEGLSGVVPSVVAFFQGVGGNPECRDYGNGTAVEISSEPRFSPRNYFFFLFATLLLSFCSFGLLRFLPSIKKDEIRAEYVEEKREREDRSAAAVDDSIGISCHSGDNRVSAEVRLPEEEEMSLPRTIYLHILVALVCFLGNGFLPGIQTYSCLPYGNVAFHLTVTLANIANPIACLFFLWFDSVHLTIIDVLSAVGTATSTYAIYLAAVSPSPPMRDSTIGVVTAVSVWILLTATISYLKLSITSKIRQKLGPKSLIRVGIVMQAGSACGAILSFGLINYTNTFQQQKPCVPL